MLQHQSVVTIESATPHSHAKRQPDSQPTLLTANPIAAQRTEIETFIRNGFATHYGADITSFLPILVAIRVRGIKAALGLRSAQQPLFVEQYLDVPIEQALGEHGLACNRTNIVEIGNLYSASSRFTLPLLLATATALFVNNINYAVFSATDALRKLFENNGLTLTYLAKANIDRLQEPHDDWGTYYDTNPSVMVLKLSDAIQLMLGQPSLQRAFMGLSDQMGELQQQLRCLK